jgi:hypothetical protein
MLFSDGNESVVMNEKRSVISSAGGYRAGSRLHHNAFKNCLAANLVEAGAGDFFCAHFQKILSYAIATVIHIYFNIFILKMEGLRTKIHKETKIAPKKSPLALTKPEKNAKMREKNGGLHENLSHPTVSALGSLGRRAPFCVRKKQ